MPHFQQISNKNLSNFLIQTTKFGIKKCKTTVN